MADDDFAIATTSFVSRLSEDRIAKEALKTLGIGILNRRQANCHHSRSGLPSTETEPSAMTFFVGVTRQIVPDFVPGSPAPLCG
jgi:hypothetical protein